MFKKKKLEKIVSVFRCLVMSVCDTSVFSRSLFARSAFSRSAFSRHPLFLSYIFRIVPCIPLTNTVIQSLFAEEC